MKVRHMVPNYELNHRALRVSAQRGRNSRKDSADAPFSMLNSVNTEIFITLNDQRRLNNKSFRTAAFSALDHDDAWRRLHALVYEPHSFRHEPHARERLEQHPQPFRPEYCLLHI